MLFPFRDQFKHLGKVVEIDDVQYIYVEDFHVSQNSSILDMQHKAMLQRIQSMSHEELCNLVDNIWTTLSGNEWNSDKLSTIADHLEYAGLQISDI